MISKAISKTGSLGACVVCTDIGSSKRLAMHSLKKLKLGLYQSGSFHPASQTKVDFIPSRPDAVLVAPIAARTKKHQTSNVGGWVLRNGRGQLRETRSTSAAPPAISRSTFPRQHRLKDLRIFQRHIHLIEIKYCEDARPQNQLSAAQEQHT